MARGRTTDEIAARLYELLNQQADLEHQLSGINQQLRGDIEALTGDRGPQAPMPRNVDLDHILDLLGRLAVAPTESDAVEVIVGVARQLLPGTRGALCRAAETGDGLATVGVWDHDDQWNRPYRGDPAAPADPRQVTGGASGGPTGTAETFPVRGFGLALGELRVWDEADSDSLPPDERHGRGELIARCAGMVLAGMYLQRCLRRNSVRDPLTGLYHQAYLLDTIGREIHRSRRIDGHLALVMFDIDRFGPFNDKHGAEQGDRMLEAIGEYMLHHFRTSDIACRYSGERFVLLLPDADITAARQRAETLRDAIGRLTIDGGRITISGGIAGYPEHGDQADDLIHAAEAGIIEARQAGGNRIQIAATD